MPVSLVAEEDVQDGPEPTRLKLVRPEPDPRAALESADQPRSSARPVVRVQYPAAEVMAVIETLAGVLALRMLLFAGFGVASYLGWLVISEPSAMKLWAMALWAAMIYLPVVFMSLRQR